MMLRLLGGAILGLAVCTVGVQGQGDKGVKDGKKDGKGKEIVGKLKEVSLTKKSFTIVTEDKKERTFLVDKDTKFVGPRGGVSAEGLKDDRMAKGNEVKVVAAPDNKTAKEVRLPFRKKATKAKDK
jgi:hypothetical protein